MKKLVRKVIIFLTIITVFFILSESITVEALNDGFLPLQESPYVSLYNKNNGNYVSGPQLGIKDIVARIAYQGVNIEEDSVIISNGRVEKGIRAINPHETLKIKNVGFLQGEPLVFALQSNTVRYTDFQVQNDKKSIRILSPNDSNKDNVEKFPLVFWIEDSHGNKINNDSVLFSLSFDMLFGNPSMDYTQITLSSSNPNIYLVAPSDLPNVLIKKSKENNDITSLTIRDTKAHSNVQNPFSFGFRQTGKDPVTTLTQQASILAQFSSLYLLNPANLFGLKVPYPVPQMMNETLDLDDYTMVNNQLQAKIEVTQVLAQQSFSGQYADPLKIIVNLNDNFILRDEDLSNIKVLDRNGKNIKTNNMVTLVQLEDGKQELVVTVPRQLQQSLADNVLTISGNLPINMSKKELFTHLLNGNYLKIPNMTVKNNQNEHSTTGNILTQVPGPTGEPVKNTSVMQNSTSLLLNPSELVTNLKTIIPDDSVKIIGIKDTNKVFNYPGWDMVYVTIEDQLTGLRKDIQIPIWVVAKDVNSLTPLKIIPEENKVAHNKDTLLYQPIYEEQVGPLKTSQLQMEDMQLIVDYNEYLDVEANDFKVLIGGNEVSPNAYTFSIDHMNHKVNFSLSNNTLINSFDKKITIYQKSRVMTDNEKIMSYYNQKKHTFDFPINGYYMFKELEKNNIIKQKPVSQAVQSIKYQPTIMATAKEPKIVSLGDKPASPEKYISVTSEPDFSFDSYDYRFEKKPTFDKLGETTFNVIVKSKTFGSELTVPVTTLVEKPKVDMTVKKMYREDITQPIFSDLKEKIPVDNTKKYQVPVGEKIDSVIENLIANEGLKLNYTGYLPITKKDYCAVNSSGDLFTIKEIPDKSFDLYIVYSGIIAIQAPNLNFGQINILNINEKFKPVVDDTKVVITNTKLNTSWNLKVALSQKITEINTGHSYSGGLLLMKNGKQEMINQQGLPIMKKAIDSSAFIVEKPLNISLYQNSGNLIGDYKG